MRRSKLLKQLAVPLTVVAIFSIPNSSVAIDKEALKNAKEKAEAEATAKRRWESGNLVNTLLQSDPRARRFPLYCRGGSGARSEVNQLLSSDRGDTYRVRWDIYPAEKSPNKVDFSKRFYGLEKGECAWEDRSISQAEPGQLCYVSGLFYASGEKNGQPVTGMGLYYGFIEDNEVWKMPAYKREKPVACLQIEFWDREELAF